MSALAQVQENCFTPVAANDDFLENREQRFNRLVGAYSDDLFRYGYWLTGDRAVAEDLVQETMLRAWKSLDGLSAEGAAKGWLLTILRRENARRFERKRLQESDVAPEDIGDQHCYYDTSTEAFVLRRAVGELQQEYREPLLMQVIQGYTQREIADHLGITVAGAGTRLFRARNKLKEMLTQ